MLGPIGLVGGAIGSNHIENVCMSCGARWEPNDYGAGFLNDYDEQPQEEIKRVIIEKEENGVELLNMLAEFKEAGIINEAEFQEKKKIFITKIK